MKKHALNLKLDHKRAEAFRLRPLFLIASLFIACVVAVSCFRQESFAQQNFPPAPSDRTLIYAGDDKNELRALPFESAVSSLPANIVAKKNKSGYVEIKGEAATTVITGSAPRFYLFIPDVQNAHTPLLMRLSSKKGARRLTAIAERGQPGFSYSSGEIVKPHIRVLGRVDGMLYVEISSREPLMPGEYAFIGTDLNRVATFRLAGASNR